MNLDEIKILGLPVSVTAEDVKVLENKLWLKFPKGYQEYITHLGEGVLAQTIRIYPPRRIEEELEQWRQRVKDYWFWDNKPILLPKERALESIVLGDTLYGDELVFHPSKPKKIFILPHEEENVLLAGNDLLDVVQKILSEVKEGTEFELNFEPYNSREIEKSFNEEFESSSGESIGDIMIRAEEWIIRNSARKQAEKALSEHLTPNTRTNLINEGIKLKTKSMGIGYFITYELVDKDTGKKLGVFEFQKSSQSYGSNWTPENL